MANKEKIDYLLLDIRELETLVAGMRDAEVYPVSFSARLSTSPIRFWRTYMLWKRPRSKCCVNRWKSIRLWSSLFPHRLPLRYKQYRKLRLQPRLRFRPNRSQSSKSRKSDRSFLQNKDYRPDRSNPRWRAGDSGSGSIRQSDPRRASRIIPQRPVGKEKFSDFRKAFSLNDRFRFRRELFGGDEARMNKVINDLNDLHSYEDSVTYLNNELKWNIEDEAVADFIKLLEKRFL